MRERGVGCTPEERSARKRPLLLPCAAALASGAHARHCRPSSLGRLTLIVPSTVYTATFTALYCVFVLHCTACSYCYCVRILHRLFVLRFRILRARASPEWRTKLGVHVVTTTQSFQDAFDDDNSLTYSPEYTGALILVDGDEEAEKAALEVCVLCVCATCMYMCVHAHVSCVSVCLGD